MANHNSKDEIVKFCLNSLKEELYGKDKDDTDFIKAHVGDYRNILFPDFDQYVEARKRRASSSYKEVKENISKFILGGVPKTREFLCEDLLRKDSDAWKSFMKASAAKASDFPGCSSICRRITELSKRKRQLFGLL